MAVLSYQDMMKILGYDQSNKKREQLYQRWAKESHDWYFPFSDLEWILAVLELEDIDKKNIKDAFHIIIGDHALFEVMSYLQSMTVIHAHPSDWLTNQAPMILHPKLSMSIIQLMAILSLIPVAKKDYKTRNIDDIHMMFNLNHLKGYIKNYRTKNHATGIELYGWTTYLASLGLVHLGSLHFMHHRYSEPFTFYRHKINHRVIAFANEGLHVRKDGQLDGVNHVSDLAFVTKYQLNNQHLIAHPIHPKGWIESTLLTIHLLEYDCILKPGDVVIDFHIPTRSDYSIKGIQQSLMMATSFFKKHYSEYDYKAFWCTSWLYSPQIFDLITKPHSNIIDIANQGYILPATPDAKSLYTFVFQTEQPDFDKIQPKTSLEKSIIDYIKSGRTINAGCYLYFLSDINDFGLSPYQTSPSINKQEIR